MYIILLLFNSRENQVNQDTQEGMANQDVLLVKTYVPNSMCMLTIFSSFRATQEPLERKEKLGD